jgi:hypothetical protein
LREIYVIYKSLLTFLYKRENVTNKEDKYSYNGKGLYSCKVGWVESETKPTIHTGESRYPDEGLKGNWGVWIPYIFFEKYAFSS